MNRYLSLRKPRHRAAGFTLVELLVVITIIGMLMALLIPAIGQAKATARNAQCVNNQKQLGLGLINYETQKQRFPGYVQPLKRDNGQSYLIVDTINGSDRHEMRSTPPGDTPQEAALKSQISWLAIIAPLVDRQDIYDVMVNHQVSGNGNPTTGDSNNPALIRPLEVAACPSDDELVTATNQAGLTYSVNTGAWDYSSVSGAATSTYVGDVAANGVFFNITRDRASGRPDILSNMSSIRDGLATTILLTENNHKEREAGAAPELSNWMGVGDRPTQDNNTYAEQLFGVVWTPFLQPNLAAVPDIAKQQLFSTEDPALTSSVYSGSALFPSNLPLFARPASNHAAGAFNACFADGHVQTLGADIDYTVYQRLLTVHGSKCEDRQNLSGSDIGTLRALPPLAESDY